LPKNRVQQEKKRNKVHNESDILVNIKTKATDRFDYVFWSGDFNYRVNMSKDNTVKLIKENNYEVNSILNFSLEDSPCRRTTWKGVEDQPHIPWYVLNYLCEQIRHARRKNSVCPDL